MIGFEDYVTHRGEQGAKDAAAGGWKARNMWSRMAMSSTSASTSDLAAARRG
ncbi:MAG: hypothetical protein CM15mP74_00270 [Halieaceae bacterium]|nr:MAG: hypothetical protein CM15mP74_00270 [Halieaceae bacterium]